MDNTEEFRCLSLCSGYAGIELGLKRVLPGLRTVAYVERDAFACANLVAKIEAGLLDAAPIWTDIKNFPAKIFRDRIYIITAGYPCQPYSTAGKRKGKDDPRYLWPDIERIIKAIRPVWFFGENVAGHLKYGFADVDRSLREMGYSVEAGLFSVAECGAPHLRCRLFFLAHDTSCGLQTMQGKQAGQPAFRNSCSVLPHAGKHRLSLTKLRQKLCGEKRGEKIKVESLYIYRWPAGPGRQQYKWEEPRTVVNSSSGRCKQSAEKLQTGRNTTNKAGRKIKSRLGRAAYGASCRLDRLRLLGNGVVPQQAEKAFRELIRKF